MSHNMLDTYYLPVSQGLGCFDETEWFPFDGIVSECFEVLEMKYVNWKNQR